jgi:hypothetical protein
MIGHASHVEYLKTLTPAELEQELNQAITDSLQELVACVQKALPQGGNTLHACVIDDFQIIETELRDHECLVRFRFTASARQGISGSKSLEQISGRAETIIGDQGHVAYQGVVFAEEPAYLAHDIGGGD